MKECRNISKYRNDKTFHQRIMKSRFLLTLVFVVLWGVIFYYSELLIFYIVLAQCTWPQLKTKTADAYVETSSQKPVYAIIFADIHLLSTNASSWFDKVRTDWEMSVAFQTALKLHQPDVVFGLGDLIDEGLYLTDTDFDHYIQHFHTLFSTPKNTDMYLIAGNHDIGFHYEVNHRLNSRFMAGFSSADVKLLTVQGNNFVLINSVLFEGNQTCSFCDDAKLNVQKLGKYLKCAEFGIECDSQRGKLANFSKPILIQHYPLYRESDKNCHEPDEAPYHRKETKFNESLDCHSKNTSKWLLKEINPRLVFSGHTHDGCATPLPNGNGVEYTLPSFNWKHKGNPSYGLAVFTPDDFAFSRCLLPTQLSALLRYIIWCATLVIALFYIFRKRRKRKSFLLFSP